MPFILRPMNVTCNMIMMRGEVVVIVVDMDNGGIYESHVRSCVNCYTNAYNPSSKMMRMMIAFILPLNGITIIHYGPYKKKLST